MDPAPGGAHPRARVAWNGAPRTSLPCGRRTPPQPATPSFRALRPNQGAPSSDLAAPASDPATLAALPLLIPRRNTGATTPSPHARTAPSGVQFVDGVRFVCASLEISLRKPCGSFASERSEEHGAPTTASASPLPPLHAVQSIIGTLDTRWRPRAARCRRGARLLVCLQCTLPACAVR